MRNFMSFMSAFGFISLLQFNPKLSTCQSHIQVTLVTFTTAKACWDHLASAYGTNGLLHIFYVWRNFVCCTYNGEGMQVYCTTYRAVLNRCLTNSQLTLLDIIPIFQILTSLDQHFGQWVL